MSEQGRDTPDSLPAMHARVQDALQAVGNIEKAIGDLGTDDLLNETRREINAAVLALQSVRDQLSEWIARGGGPAAR